MKVKLDKETVIKHLFWFLLPVVVILWLICQFSAWSVMNTTGKNWDETRKVANDLDGLKARERDIKNQKWIEAARDQTQAAFRQKMELWDAAHKAQNGIVGNWDKGLLEALGQIRDTLAANQASAEAAPETAESSSTGSIAVVEFKDDAKLFSPQTVAAANDLIAEIKRRFHKDVTIVTSNTAEGQSVSAGPDTIAILLCRTPVKVQVAVDEGTSKLFPKEKAEAVRSLLDTRLKEARVVVTNPLITWPKTPPSLFASLEALDFGEQGNVPREYIHNDKGYIKQFDEMIPLVNPWFGKGVTTVYWKDGGGAGAAATTPGGTSNDIKVARRVLNDWQWKADKDVTPEEAWMEQERMAVLRELLKVVAEANDAVATLKDEFREVPVPEPAKKPPADGSTNAATAEPAAAVPPAPPPLDQRRFVNTTWQIGVAKEPGTGIDNACVLDLELVRTGNQIALQGAAVNRSLREEVPAMPLKVFVSDGDARVEPLKDAVQVGQIPKSEVDKQRTQYTKIGKQEIKKVAVPSWAKRIVRVQRMPAQGVLDHQRLANPYWLVDLQMVKKAGGQVELKGSIYNRSGRSLSPLSFNSPPPPAQPQLIGFEVRVRDEKNELAPVELNIKEKGEKRLRSLAAGDRGDLQADTPWNSPQRIVSVKQILDWNFAPIKRIDRIETGAEAHKFSDRTNFYLAQLKPYDFERKKPGGGSGTPTAVAKFGAHDVPAPRYYEVTQEVRRLPVAMVLIVDPAYLNDVNTSLANSRLRIQTTLAAWQQASESVRPKTRGSAPASTGGTVGGGEETGRTTETGGAVDPTAVPRTILEELVELQVYGLATIYESPEAQERRQNAAPSGQ